MIPATLLESLQAARRPIFIWGAGIRTQAEKARALARRLGVPVACTWGAIDLLHHDDPLMVGGFGTHGTRAANFAVQNADLVIALGTRLDTKATGSPAHFARAASLCMVDVDQAELDKMPKVGRAVDWPICADVGEFIAQMQRGAEANAYGHRHEWEVWEERIDAWKQRYATPTVDWPGINPYELMKEIAQWTSPDDVIVSDTGCALGWIMQGFPFKGERFLHAFNMTPMGYGLPAAIGAAFAAPNKRVVLITGDGSLMMSLCELATLARWNLPIKIILLNNGGHAMCRQTQRQWLGGKYPGTSVEGGLGFPNWDFIPFTFNLTGGEAFDAFTLTHFFTEPAPNMIVLPIHPDAQLIPQAKYGQPLEDADPPLPREEFFAQMIIEPLPA